jgi:diguanylate cyclase (GGDEF)-like protein/PAS domain S-box-containing protein
MKKRQSKSPARPGKQPLKKTGGKEKVSVRSAVEETKWLLQELQSHQVELESQNSELREAHAGLEESRNRYSDLYDFAPVGYFTFDRAGLILEANLTGAGQLGMGRPQIIEKPFSLFVSKEDQSHFRAHLAAVFKEGGPRHCVVKIEGKNAPFYVRMESLMTPVEGARHCRTAVTDITPQKRAEEEIRELNGSLENQVLQRTAELREANQALQNEITERKKADHALALQANLDSLTGLYNRRYFDLRAEEEIARANRNGKGFAILLCDLDHFKAINDTLGHQAGDRVLKAAAEGIQRCIREVDFVFRWGGDEIALLLLDASREGVLITAERIRREVEKVGEKTRIPLGISIGVSFYPEHGTTIDGLISLADRSLYIAKKGGDKVQVGDEEYHLDEQNIRTVFQPVVDLHSRRPVGYEALLRDPQGKLTVPELFHRYQRIGRLNELKRISFHSQMNEARKFGRTGARLFLNADFDLLSQMGLIEKPEGIEVVLEISEVEALHSQHIASYLALAEKWRARGFQFAIDDFGAGFVSFPFIAQLVPEYIKIDRSTLLQAVSCPKFRKFLADLIFALQNYTTRGIIAEGIETEEELAVARELRADFGQGFLLGRPEILGPA